MPVHMSLVTKPRLCAPHRFLLQRVTRQRTAPQARTTSLACASPRRFGTGATRDPAAAWMGSLTLQILAARHPPLRHLRRLAHPAQLAAAARTRLLSQVDGLVQGVRPAVPRRLRAAPQAVDRLRTPRAWHQRHRQACGWLPAPEALLQPHSAGLRSSCASAPRRAPRLSRARGLPAVSGVPPTLILKGAAVRSARGRSPCGPAWRTARSRAQWPRRPPARTPRGSQCTVTRSQPPQATQARTRRWTPTCRRTV